MVRLGLSGEGFSPIVEDSSISSCVESNPSANGRKTKGETMLKWFFIAVLTVGAFFLVNAYLPTTWTRGFHAMGAQVPWALVIIGGVLVLGIWKIKTK
jgi:predicted MFS family arabinose efflux permease